MPNKTLTDDQLNALGRWAMEVSAVPLWVEADIIAITTELRQLREERALQWTAEPPKVIGWYFWKSDTFNGHGYTNTIYVDNVRELVEGLTRSRHKNIMFAGPIQEPRNYVIKHDLRREMEG